MLGLGGALACLFPADQSTQLSVDLDPVPELYLKDTLQLSARVVTAAGESRVSYAFVPSIAIELGAGRRSVKPAFSTQAVGLVRLGVLSQIPLNRVSSVWARGAYLVRSGFNGGGSADLAVELGLGVGVGTPNGRFRGRTDFEFQRIDRKVASAGVPLQMAVGRIGVEVGF